MQLPITTLPWLTITPEKSTGHPTVSTVCPWLLCQSHLCSPPLCCWATALLLESLPTTSHVCPTSVLLHMLFPLTQCPAPDICIAHPFSSPMALFKGHIFRTFFLDPFIKNNHLFLLHLLTQLSLLLRYYINLLIHLLSVSCDTLSCSPLCPNALIRAGTQRPSICVSCLCPPLFIPHLLSQL